MERKGVYMKIVVITDMDIKGSGYKNLSVPLLEGLAKNGHEIKVAGLSYKGEEHWWDFSVIPAQNVADAIAIIKNLDILWDIDVLLVLLDIPIQEGLLGNFAARDFKYVGVFPVEAGPLCMSWAMVISQMDKALVISEFGTEEVRKTGIQAEHLQIGIDTDVWKAPTDKQKKELRESFGIDEDTFVILTVADNQERKNLSRSMEIVSDYIKEFPDRKVQYILVTREHFWGGWKIQDYAQTLGISGNMIVVERGVPFEKLWGLYAMSDAFLLTSKAEGLGMPILEAMAMKVPVVCTNATAMQELIGNGERGYPIDYFDAPEFDPYVDPFGNAYRYFAKRKNGVVALGISQGSPEIVQDAYDYVNARTHQISIDQLERVLNGL